MRRISPSCLCQLPGVLTIHLGEYLRQILFGASNKIFAGKSGDQADPPVQQIVLPTHSGILIRAFLPSVKHDAKKLEKPIQGNRNGSTRANCHQTCLSAVGLQTLSYEDRRKSELQLRMQIRKLV